MFSFEMKKTSQSFVVLSQIYSAVMHQLFFYINIDDV